MIEASAFIQALKQHKHTFVSGVPCSFLKPFINQVIDSPDLDYIPASSEGEAVGITLGAYLAGRKTISICQNSGLGNMVNPLTSLNYPFKIPTLVITSWRGEPGRSDEPQHELMGQITQQLLDLMQIPHHAFPQSTEIIDSVVNDAVMWMQQSSRPYAFVMRKGDISPVETLSDQKVKRIKTKWLQKYSDVSLPKNDRPTRLAALETLLETIPEHAAVVSTTGKTSRELYTLSDRKQHFYVVGGMGTASAIGLGVAVNINRPVMVIDGDGAALMKLGAMASVGAACPSNLIHLILDNEVHDSTGGQSTSSATVDFASFAAATNYRHVAVANTLSELRESIANMIELEGPNLIHMKIRSGSMRNLGRPKLSPVEVKERFMSFLKEEF